MLKCYCYLGRQASVAAAGTDTGRDLPLGQSFLAGRAEKCLPQPIWSLLAGITDSRRHFLRFFGWQSNGKEDGDARFGQPGPAHFLFHRNIRYLLTNVIDTILTFVNISLITQFESELYQNNTRTSLSRHADQGH